MDDNELALWAELESCQAISCLSGRLAALPDSLGFDDLCERISSGDGRNRAAALCKLAVRQRLAPGTAHLVRDSLKDEDVDVRAVAATVLARLWGGEVAAILLLRERLEAEQDAYVHAVVLEELLLCGKDDRDLFAYFKTTATSAPRWAARQEAVVALARAWKQEPETLPLLQSVAVADADESVRLQALGELRSAWAHDPATIALLQERAFQDRSPALRENLKAELRPLGIGGGFLSNDATVFKNLALHHVDPQVRQAALVWLLQAPEPQDVNLSDLCRRIAVHDADEFMRGLALQALAGTFEYDPSMGPVNDPRYEQYLDLPAKWADDPRTVSLLQERALKDPSYWIREKLRKTGALASDRDAFWENLLLQDGDPATRRVALIRFAQERLPTDEFGLAALCRKVAVHDPDASLRGLALEIAALSYKADSGTLDLLCERGTSDPDPVVRDRAAFLSWWIPFGSRNRPDEQ